MQGQFCWQCIKSRQDQVVASRVDTDGLPLCSWCHVGLEGPNDPKAKLYNFNREVLPTAPTPTQNMDQEVTLERRPGYEKHIKGEAQRRNEVRQVNLVQLKIDYEGGMPIKAIAAKHGFPIGAWQFYMVKAKITLRGEKCSCGKPSHHRGACIGVSRGPYKPEKIPEARKLLAEGKSTRSVASVVGLSKKTVTEIRKGVDEIQPCACGKPAGHRGWCKDRFSKSELRKETMKNLQARRNGNGVSSLGLGGAEKGLEEAIRAIEVEQEEMVKRTVNNEKRLKLLRQALAAVQIAAVPDSDFQRTERLT